MVARVADWLPQAGANVTAVVRGQRTVPLDGFPVVGFTEEGVYVVCAHSGVTLAPLLGAAVAAELVGGVECEVLGEWRGGGRRR